MLRLIWLSCQVDVFNEGVEMLELLVCFFRKSEVSGTVIEALRE
jgi:hypothetical protein